MSARIHRIDLAVESLRQAENFYTLLFHLPIAYREASEDGQIKKLHPDDSWEDALIRGLRPEKSVLGSSEFQIALCRTPAEFAQRGRLAQVSLTVDSGDFGRLACAAGDLGCDFTELEDTRLVFRDPYGISWEAAASSRCEQSV